MTPFMQSEIFFFIASIGFVMVGVVIFILVIYAIKVARSLLRIVERIESSMDDIGDATIELIEDLRNNVFFRMLFHTKKKRHSTDRKSFNK